MATAPRASRLIVVTASWIAACGPHSPPPVEPQPIAATPSTVVEERTAPRSTSPGGTVFFAVVDNDLVPLACTHGRGEEVLRGETCLAMVAEGAEVAVDVEHSPHGCSPSVRRLARVTGQTEVLCIDDGVPGLSVDLPEPGEGCWATGFAIWPTPAMEGAHRVAFMDDPPPSAPLPTALARTLERSIGEEGPLALHQLVTVDAGPDGAPLQLISASVSRSGADPASPSSPVVDPSTGEMESPYVSSGLFVGAEGAQTLRSVLRSEWEIFEVLASIDLDGDGQQEVFVRSSYYEGSAVELIRIVPEGRVRLGLYACGH